MLSHPSHQKNLELIIKILLENDYPLNFIFKTISNRIRHLIINSNNKTQNDQKISYLDDKIINSWLSFHILAVIRKNLGRLWAFQI